MLIPCPTQTNGRNIGTKVCRERRNALEPWDVDSTNCIASCPLRSSHASLFRPFDEDDTDHGCRNHGGTRISFNACFLIQLNGPISACAGCKELSRICLACKAVTAVSDRGSFDLAAGLCSMCAAIAKKASPLQHLFHGTLPVAGETITRTQNATAGAKDQIAIRSKDLIEILAPPNGSKIRPLTHLETRRIFDSNIRSLSGFLSADNITKVLKVMKTTQVPHVWTLYQELREEVGLPALEHPCKNTAGELRNDLSR